MPDHRLPGMSISGEEWAALTRLAESLNVTRTDLIRRAITSLLVDGGPVGGDVYDELAKARRQLAAVRAVLATGEPVVAA